MIIRNLRVLTAFALFAAVGCASVPSGPSVQVMPAPGKPFDLFQQEDVSCRQWASQQIGSSPQDTANKHTASGALTGGAIGAGLGALFTGGEAGAAAFGAATGALIGASQGAAAGQYYGAEAQHRYDAAYQQCMYSNGNLIPGVKRHYRSTPPPPPPPDLRSQGPEGSQPGPVPPPPAPQ